MTLHTHSRRLTLAEARARLNTIAAHNTGVATVTPHVRRPVDRRNRDRRTWCGADTTGLDWTTPEATDPTNGDLLIEDRVCGRCVEIVQGATL